MYFNPIAITLMIALSGILVHVGHLMPQNGHLMVLLYKEDLIQDYKNIEKRRIYLNMQYFSTSVYIRETKNSY